ncbi:MAG: response regulator [Desulfamplus sp.]|nr:response regulator [Desulfamplus sp.]
MSMNKKRAFWEIPDNPDILFEEIMVARRASDITAKLVVEQFVKMDSMLHQLEENINTEKELRSALAEKLHESEQRENELALARAAAETANEAKSAFLASTSHELRTPLTSILGFAKIIQKRLTESIFPLIQTDNKKINRSIKQVKENISIIVSEGERLTNLINNVLDLAKIESGKTEWHMEPIAISELISRSKSATTSLFEEAGLPLIIDIPDDLPPVTGDIDQLMQVLINLLSNAVKFTEEGEITCRAGYTNDEIMISVIDTGIGIKNQVIETVFDKFTQIGDTLTNKPKGTGLGLTICKQIVEYHQGRIGVESEVGRGSSFYFTLPVAPETASLENLNTIYQNPDMNNAIQQLKERLAFLGSQPDNHSKTILVVDDEHHIRNLLRQSLEGEDYTVLEAKNGIEAIKMVKQNRPDLILLDVMMPEMSGFDVAAVLKNNPQTKSIPIVILSILTDKVRGYHIGVDSYFTKPVNMESLLCEISFLISQKKSKKQVLVVDEDESALKNITSVLRMKGYTVAEALSVEECLGKAKSMKPDMVFIDALYSKKHDIIRTLRFEKDLEKILFILLDKEKKSDIIQEMSPSSKV